MKKALLALVAATAFTGSAFAADLARKAPPMAPPPPPPPTFTGCWLSGGIGYGLFDQETTAVDTFGNFDSVGFVETDTFSNAGRGWLGRVGGGCDYQFGGGYGGGGLFGGQGFVIGGFADYDWTDIHGQMNDRFSGFENAGVGNEKMSNQWAIGARVGWVPLPGLLTFVSGGYTQAHFNGVAFTNLFTGDGLGTPTGIVMDGRTYHGWFIGGGEEYAFNWLPVPGLFWKTEYRFSEFDRQSVLVRDLFIPDGDGNFSYSNKKFVQTITTSLVWRFNWGGYGGPVVAKY
jgi:outer membrane immunogenic protein